MHVIKVCSVHSIHFSESPNKCWLHTCDACVITTWRLGLWANLFVRSYTGTFKKVKDQLAFFILSVTTS